MIGAHVLRRVWPLSKRKEEVGFLIPNPPKDTDGRREESGRRVRELQGK